MSSRPEKPDDSACCGSGCKPCIFDVYEEQLKKWNQKQHIQQSSAALDPLNFLPFLVENIEVMTPQIKIFHFQSVKLLKTQNSEDCLISNAEPEIDYEVQRLNLFLRAGHYLILKGKSDSDLPFISRSYTPVLNDCTQGCFKIIVSLFSEGKMSQFLGKLKPRDIVFWRGPYTEFQYHTNKFRHILLIGGGTGIVPLYNIAKEIVENDLEETQILFLASFQSVETLILRRELNKLQEYWNFKIQMHITNQKNLNYSLGYNENVIFSKLDRESIYIELSKFEKDKIFVVVCGPDGFNTFIYDTLLECGTLKENIFVFR